jgi:DNA-3-methyladenine glycosylase II
LTFTEYLIVPATAPFDFDLTAYIFSNGDVQIRNYANGFFRQVLKINGKLFQIKVASNGTVEKPALNVELKSNSPITREDRQKAAEAVSFIFNLQFKLKPFYDEIKNDSVISKIARHFYGLKNPTTPTVFESLVDSIVEQQISIKVAIALEGKLTKKFGEHIAVDGETYFAFPSPQALASASVEAIQQVGLSRRKAEYIQGAAELIAGGKLDLERLKEGENPEEIISVLDAVRGIGVWTAELTMLRGMQKLEAFPADDLGVRRVISKYYCSRKPIDAEEAREIAKKWGRWKGLAAFYLIIAEIKGIAL